MRRTCLFTHFMSAIVAVTFVACGGGDGSGLGDEQKGCETTSDCAQGQTCVPRSLVDKTIEEDDGEKVCTDTNCSSDDECKDGGVCKDGLCTGGGCTLLAGQCPNYCESGDVLQGDSCIADADCDCGLSCTDGEKKVEGPKTCPNLNTEGFGVKDEACTTPNQCECGLRCKDKKCQPYDGDDADCDCGGRSCQPITGDNAGCSCDWRHAGQCVPNANVTCPCLGGGSGVQTCNASGTAFSLCECPGTDGSDGTDGGDGTDATDGGDGTDGACVVRNAKFKKICVGSNVVWEDNCGNKGDIDEECKGGATCANGQCNKGDVCIPKAKTFCNEGQLYFYDTCGNKQGVPLGGCAKEEFCIACDVGDDSPSCPVCKTSLTACCVKPFYDGDWMMTAAPKPGACTTFPPQVLKLKINGTKAEGSVTSIGITVTFSGTLDGKHLTMKTNYDVVTSLGTVKVTEDLDVFFKSSTEFSGTDYVVQDIVGFPCSAAFAITGKKQF